MASFTYPSIGSNIEPLIAAKQVCKVNKRLRQVYINLGVIEQDREGLIVKRAVFASIFSVLFLIILSIAISVRADSDIWLDNLTYSSINGLEAAGWVTSHSSGISFTSTGIVLDGSDADTTLHKQNLPAGVFNWAAETKSRWLGAGHSGSSVYVVTEKHVYGFMPDGYYDNFAFYRDSAKVKTFEGYQEKRDTWITLKMEKSGEIIKLYYNGELIGNYTEVDTTPSQVTGVYMVSPWKGDAEYDYFKVWSLSNDGSTVNPTAEPNETVNPTSTVDSTGSQFNSFFSNPLVIIGIIGGAVAGAGAAVYYFVAAGGSEAAGSAGASSSGDNSGGGGSGAGSNDGGGSLVHPSSSVPSTLQSTEASTLNEVAMDGSNPMNYHTPTMEEIGIMESDNLNMLHEASNIQAEQNAASNNLQQTTQSVQDTVNAGDQQIQNNTTNNQNILHQQTNQLLQGSNKPNQEVADSGSSSSES